MSLSINDVTNKYMYTNSKTGQTRLNLDTSADFGNWLAAIMSTVVPG